MRRTTVLPIWPTPRVVPEGPEIRRAADRLERAVARHAASEVFFAFEHLKPYERRLRGRQVTGIETRGKAMLAHFDNRLSVYSHNQLYGRWMIRRAYDYPRTARQLRFAIHNERKSALLYSASEIEVLTPEQIAEHRFLSSLGPDVVTAPPERILDQVQSDRFRRRRLSALLLDQRFLAGVGNYLRSEILFVAGLQPSLRPIDCSVNQLEDLARAAATIARRSYRHNGVTNDLEIARALKAQGQTRSRYRHWVFDRADRPCRSCGAPVVGSVAASRRIYYCPCCQSG
jgi:endonuclease-8